MAEDSGAQWKCPRSTLYFSAPCITLYRVDDEILDHINGGAQRTCVRTTTSFH